MFVQLVFRWILKLAGVKLTQVVARAAIDALVKSTKTPYDDIVWEKIKKEMGWN